MADGGSRVDFVVLDTTVLIADYWLRSPSFLLLYDYLSKSEAVLVIPQIVFEETVNHYKEDLKAATSELQKASRELVRLLPNFPSSPSYPLQIFKLQKQEPYDKFLHEKLRTVGAQIVPYDEIPQKDIVRRDLGRRRPFQPSGKGYRDTLMWETVLRHCLAKPSRTVLITNNLKDFSDPSGGQLHTDLRTDALGIGADRVVELFHDLPDFTDAYVVPFLKKRKDFAELISAKQMRGLDLNKICEEKIDVLIEAINRSPASMIGDPGTYEPEVDTIDVPKDIDIVEASELSEDRLLVVFEFQASVAFIYFLPRSEYITMSDERTSEIAILDPDWNESVMRVEAITFVTARCRLTFNMKTEEVESFEVENVEGVSPE
jgi:predicted nucleic acid-binding protein